MAADTLGDLADAFIHRHAKLYKRSWREDNRMLETCIKPILGEKKAHSLTRREIAQLPEPIAERALLMGMITGWIQLTLQPRTA